MQHLLTENKPEQLSIVRQPLCMFEDWPLGKRPTGTYSASTHDLFISA
jgi:hypothetical protein